MRQTSLLIQTETELVMFSKTILMVMALLMEKTHSHSIARNGWTLMVMELATMLTQMTTMTVGPMLMKKGVAQTHKTP